MKDKMKYLIFNLEWELAKLPMGKKALHKKMGVLSEGSS